MSAAISEMVVREFFDRYRRHDVDGMTDLCSLTAEFSYVPFEIWENSACSAATARSAPSERRSGTA
jgi:hypothetical protein